MPRLRGEGGMGWRYGDTKEEVWTLRKRLKVNIAKYYNAVTKDINATKDAIQYFFSEAKMHLTGW